MSGNDNDLFDPSGNPTLIGGDHLHIINEALEQINSSVTADVTHPLRFGTLSGNHIINDASTFLGPLMSNLIDYNRMNVPRRPHRLRRGRPSLPLLRRARIRPPPSFPLPHFNRGSMGSSGATGSNGRTAFSSLLQGMGSIGDFAQFREALRSSLGQRPTPYKKVLSEEGEKCVEDYLFEAGTHEEKCCPITQVDFPEGSVVARLPCEHIFDKQAVLKWLREEDARCPVCRHELPHKEVRIMPSGTGAEATGPDPSGNEVSEAEDEADHVESANALLQELQDQVMQIVAQQEEAEDERRMQAAILASLSLSGPTGPPPADEESDEEGDDEPEMTESDMEQVD